VVVPTVRVISLARPAYSPGVVPVAVVAVEYLTVSDCAGVSPAAASLMLETRPWAS
jgi:hypothetical protein